MKKRSVQMLGGALALYLVLSAGAVAFAAGEPNLPVARGVLAVEEVVAPQYQNARPFSEGLAAVMKDGKWGYIDTEGAAVIPFTYDLAYEFHEGLAIVGHYATRTDTDRSGATVENQVCLLGFVDHDGRYTAFQMPDPVTGGQVPCYLYTGKVAQAWAPPESLAFQNGLASLPSQTPVRYLNTTDGGVLETPMIPAGPMNEGYCPGYPLDKGGACGYFDASGKTVLYWDQSKWTYFGDKYTGSLGQAMQSYRYTSAVLPYNQGLAPAWQTTYHAETGKETSLLGFLNTSGGWAIQPAYSGYQCVDNGGVWEVFGDAGLAAVQKGGKFGAINRAGETIIPFQYEELQGFSEGLAVYRQDGKYGYLDTKGAVVIPARFNIATPFHNGLAAVQEAGASTIIDRTGLPVSGLNETMRVGYFTTGSNGSVKVQPTADYSVIQIDGAYGYVRMRYQLPLPGSDVVGNWALQEVTAALESDLVPAHLQNLYQEQISRREFCKLAIHVLCEELDVDRDTLVQRQTGKRTDQWVQSYPFQDTTDSDVIAAYALGIVSGRGGPVFDPYAQITRQEAAALLTRMAALLGMDTLSTKDVDYVDNDQISVWFQDAVGFVTQSGVMGSVGNQTFHPLGAYTREQAYVTVYRLAQARGDHGTPIEEPQPAEDQAPAVEDPSVTEEPVPPEATDDGQANQPEETPEQPHKGSDDPDPQG